MQPTRRHLLHTAGAGGLVGALALLAPDLAAAAPELEDDGFEELASRLVDQLTGRHLLVPGQARFDDLIEDIDSDADEFLDQLSLWALSAFADLELNQLVFFEVTEAGALDLRVVDEEISGAIVWSDETKALFAVEPFHSSLCHIFYLFLMR